VEAVAASEAEEKKSTESHIDTYTLYILAEINEVDLSPTNF